MFAPRLLVSPHGPASTPCEHSGVHRVVGGVQFGEPGSGADWMGFTGTARQSVQAMILHVPRNFLNSETGRAEAGKAQVQGL